MRLTGGQIVAEYLIKEGVPYIIGIPGHGSLGLLDAFKGKEKKIRVLQVKQEMAAVHMADGYYRVTGQPLAVYTSIGPGAVNAAIGVATCYVDSTPVLLLTGNTHTHMFGKGVLQEIERRHDADFPRMYEPIVKRYWQATRVEQLPSIMQRAFNQMMTGRRGPVLIDLPMDVQCESADVEIPQPAAHRSAVRPVPDPGQVAEAVRLMKSAKRPVIVAGGGVVASNAFEELKELAELWGAAVVTTMMGKGSFPEDHELYGWHGGSKGTSCGSALTSTADILLAVGCRFTDETACSYRHGVSYAIPPTRLIHVDIDAHEIGKNYPAAVGIAADAKRTMGALVEGLKAEGCAKEYRVNAYFKEIQELKKEWFLEMAPWRESDKVPMTISALLKELREFLDRDAVVVHSSGNTQAQILQEFCFYEPRTNITTGGFSTMGFTLPAALGVKLALPRRQVVGVTGDGDFMMTMQELSTAVQYDLPIVLIIANNLGWLAIKDLQMAAYGEDRAIAVDFAKESGEMYSPDFVAIAQGFGCWAKKISRKQEVKPALMEAFAAGRPAVIEAMTSREFPYSGGKVAGWWDVPVPAYLTERRAKYEREKAGERL